jgi:hypothetical protein
MTDFGKVTLDGKTYSMTAQAELTNRVFTGWFGEAAGGETYWSEWSAPAVDTDENEYEVYWQFEQIKGDEQEPDTLNWDDADRVRTAK